jgi:hypothetical protein
MEVVNFTTQLLYTFGRLDVSSRQLGCYVEEKDLLFLLRIEPLVLSQPARRLSLLSSLS